MPNAQALAGVRLGNAWAWRPALQLWALDGSAGVIDNQGLVIGLALVFRPNVLMVGLFKLCMFVVHSFLLSSSWS